MKTPFALISALLVIASISVRASAQTDEARHTNGVEGDNKTLKSRVLEAGAEVLQKDGPFNSIHAHVCGFHFYSGDLKRQVRADHYCSHINEDVWQCVIYDSDQKNARLIGVEYIISEKLFNTLPAEEKKLWHSHRYEVMSGELIAPGIPDPVEKEMMKDLVNTYGKTWHFWQVDRGDRLPLGLPKLMMGFTADGQVNSSMVAARDNEFKVDSSQVKKDRAGLPAREVAPGANAWEKGDVFQLPDSLLTGSAQVETPVTK